MLQKRYRKIILFISILGVLLLWGTFALAQVDVGLEKVGEKIALGKEDIRIIIAKIIRVFLGLLGIIAVSIIIYGGFIWMTARGDPKKIDQAKSILTSGVIGLVIILSSFAIVQFIFKSLKEALYGRERKVEEYVSQYSERLSGALGLGIIESHYPARSATDIARNTRIIITFKEAMDLSSIIEDVDGDGIYGSAADKLNSENIKISKSAEKTEGPYVGARAGVTSDKRTFIFIPDEYLGSPTENVWYTVSLKGGRNGIKKEDGSPAFEGNFAEGYAWEFETGTFLDVTPPKILSFVPRGGTHSRNIVIQMNFSEAIDPISASGIAEVIDDVLSGFTNIEVKSGDLALPGSFSISNGYKTVEFMTNDFCGVNSCGGDVYCLPPNAEITTLIKAATLSATPPTAEFPYDGIVDLAGNSFDGNGDGIAFGPPNDNASSTFRTNNTIDLTPPKIILIYPNINQGGVALDDDVFIIFDKVMSATTLNNNNIALQSEITPPSKEVYKYWFFISSENLNQNNEPTLDEPSRTKVEIKHSPFAPSTDLVRFDYFPSASSTIKDLMQNCYFPGVGPSVGGVCEATADAPYCCNGVPSRNKCAQMP